MITLTCLQCDRDFTVRLSRTINGRAKYCSKECHNVAQNKGRVIIHDGGYILMKDKSYKQVGYYYLHRRIAESIMGRHLHKDEVVHHVDGNAQNNDINNIMILSRSEHMRLHCLERAKKSGIDDPINYRRCHYCKVIKLNSEYSPSVCRGKKTLASKCKPCASKWQRENRILQKSKSTS